MESVQELKSLTAPDRAARIDPAAAFRHAARILVREQHDFTR